MNEWGIGVHEMPELTYHADPAPEPSLSSSIGKILLERSPQHAWTAHARLGKRDRSPTKAMDFGAAAHDVLLRGESGAIVWCDYPDFRTKAAREEKNDAHARGLIPILSHEAARLDGVTSAVRHKIADELDTYKRESVFLWKEDDVWCRSMIDIADPSGKSIVDLKFTDLHATPEGWGRTQMWEYMLQVGFYRRAVWTLLADKDFEPLFFFLVAETKPPYGVRTFEPDRVGYAVADELAERAIFKWQECAAHGWDRTVWPNYESGITRMETPVWLMRKWGIWHED